ncbi:MAG: hypothetical protein H6715_05350 [Myxococcales bacterium]|nr:hypothetical protein [Myxococcales bacterium]MCB9709409.1 hypothetical protein [Myxococcales bacterium]
MGQWFEASVIGGILLGVSCGSPSQHESQPVETITVSRELSQRVKANAPAAPEDKEARKLTKDTTKEHAVAPQTRPPLTYREGKKKVAREFGEAK